MSPAIRRQLSLFVPACAAELLEAVRSVVDPIQQSLIPAHLTLCREDEIAHRSPSFLQTAISEASPKPITLRFGPPVVFQGHGILLRCIEGEDEFTALRKNILQNPAPRHAEPHITLAHPRNPKASGNSLHAASALAEGLAITFDVISLIEQEGKKSWQVLWNLSLRREANS